jgi:hypothetical protein
MSTYPGEDPQQPAGQQPDSEQPADQQPDQQPPAEGEGDTELTQPVGYWERQAAEQARQQTQQGDPDPSAAQGGDPVFNPTTAQSSPGSAPGWDQGTTRPYEQTPYPTYAQPYPQPGQPYGQPYGQPGYGPPPGQPAGPPPGQPPYGYPPAGGHYGPPAGGHPGYPAPYGTFNPPLPNHPQATISMVLGIIGLAGGLLLCGVGLLASPFAWALGRNALKEIEASHGRLGGEGSARAGMIMGIIGSILLALALVGLILFAVLLFASDTSSGSSI